MSPNIKYAPEEREERYKEVARNWREANKDRLRNYMTDWRASHREHMRATAQRWRDANPRKWRPRILKQKYGWTLEDYRDALVGQAGRCLICGLVPATDLVIDHDHGTGKVRGLLCDMCNRMLGHAHDDPQVFRRAIAYLEQH